MPKLLVKVQVSLFTSEQEAQVMVYDEKKSFMYQGDAHYEIVKAMGGEHKKFFYANVPEQPGYIRLICEAPWQSW